MRDLRIRAQFNRLILLPVAQWTRVTLRSPYERRISQHDCKEIFLVNWANVYLEELLSCKGLEMRGAFIRA